MYNKPIDLDGVITLTMGDAYNQTIDLAGVKTLTMGYFYNQPIDSKNVTHLTMGRNFNHPIDITRVTHLTICNPGYSHNLNVSDEIIYIDSEIDIPERYYPKLKYCKIREEVLLDKRGITKSMY